MSDVEDAMARLRERFVARATAELGDLRRWSSDLSDPPDELGKLVHRLAGAGGTFGYSRLSDCAKTAEDALITGGPDRRAALADLIGELEQLTVR